MDAANERSFSFFLEQINQLIANGSSVDDILTFIFDGLSTLIPFDRLGIGLLVGEESIRLYWVKANMKVEFLKKNYTAKLKQGSLARLIKTGAPRIIPDLVQYLNQHPESQATKLAIMDGIRSSLTFPLKANGNPIGAVFFSSRTENAFSLEHAELFAAVAGEIAVIVEQARLKNYFDLSEKREKSVSRIIHDLRSPISIMQGYLEFAQDEAWFKDLTPEAKKFFGVLTRNAEHAMALIKDLSEVRQLSSGRLGMVFSKVNLPHFVQEMASFGRMLAQHKDIVFADIQEGDLPSYAEFDEMNVRRVLDNLFSNAVKFSNRGKAITFSCRAGGGKVHFRVADHGQGIPLEEQSLLFKEFGKTSVRPTEGESSTGLGLAIAKEILQRHGGDIKVTSTPGQGSTFEFWIPEFQSH